MKFMGKIGPGRRYDSSRIWDEGLIDVFGYKPFEGTLNIYVRPNLKEDDVLKKFNLINPFKDFICIEGSVNGVKSYFCYSKNRKHKNISTFYVVSEFKLREKFNFKDAQWIDIELKEKDEAD